jgi:CheY-like chemotaxis protein
MKKIVVVDDQAVLTSIYRAKFSAEGFQVAVAGDGEQALDVIKRTRPDLVLLDLMLPKISGLEVLKQLRAHSDFKTTPIVVFSNAAQPSTVEDAWAAGATLVLSKSSTSPKQLVESVQSVLANRSALETKVDEFRPLDRREQISDANAPAGAAAILLIENNPECRAIVSHLLKGRGYRIIHGEGQEHALLLNEATRVDLVLANSVQFRDSFRTFSQQLRRRRPELPLVMYSMGASAKAAEEAIREGVSRFLRTPQEFLDLAAISATLMSENRVAQ